MARSFNGSTQYLELDSAPVTVPPFTLACWFLATATATLPQSLLWVGDKDSTGDWHELKLTGSYGVSLNQTLWALSRDASYVQAETTTQYSASTWHHACGVFSATNSRSAYLDGAGKHTDTNEKTPDALDRIAIARTADDSPGGYFEGSLADAAIWNAALTDAEVASLAAGFSPLFIRPQNLMAYYLLIRADQDRVGDYDLTAYNTPGITAHPPMIYPTSHHAIHIGAAAPPAAAAIAILAHQNIHSLVFGGVTVR